MKVRRDFWLRHQSRESASRKVLEEVLLAIGWLVRVRVAISGFQP